jgi:hypothetical protein
VPELSDVTDLGGSSRSVVLRARAGPLAELAASVAAALRREYGDHPLLPAPAFR